MSYVYQPPRVPARSSFCAQIYQALKVNPYLVQALQRRPDLLHSIRSRCGGIGVGVIRPPPRRRPYPRPDRNTPIPPYPQPTPRPPRPPRPNYPPRPIGGCGPGKRFDSCGCQCVDKNAITPMCIRNCTQCAVGQVFNWCTLSCVPVSAKIKQCPPLA